MRIAAREHPPRGPGPRSGCQKLGRDAGAKGGDDPQSRRPAEEKKKKKKVEKEAFQVKLLGSEQPRFRAMTRGGRTHGVQGTLLGSAARARRGFLSRRPHRGPPARAHVERRGAGRARRAARVPGVRAPAPRRGRSRPSAAAGPACAPLRGRGGPGVGAEGLWFHCSGGSCVLVRK